MTGLALFLAVASATRVPITNEVFIGGRSQGSGSDLDAFMFQCYTQVYQPPVAMGIIEKGTVVKVVGSDIQIKMHMRGRCEGYGSFDYTLGKCDPKLGGAAGETPADEMTVDHAIQSYEIVMCQHTGVSEESWQDLIGTGEVATVEGGVGEGGLLAGPAEEQAPGPECWTHQPCKYFEAGHGDDNCGSDGGPYSSAEDAKAACAAAGDCEAIVAQSNHCGGSYRVTHGSASANYREYGCDGEWQDYNLHAIEFTC